MLVCFHVRVQFQKSILVHLGANIEHEAILGFQILADSLEKPLVGVDLAIVAMLDSKHYVHSSALQNVFLQTQIPSRHLPHVKQISWMIFTGNRWIHDLF